jgi:hypothetical protein
MGFEFSKMFGGENKNSDEQTLEKNISALNMLERRTEEMEEKIRINLNPEASGV